MLKTILSVVKDGKIELLEKADLPEGARALVTLLPNEDEDFWLNVTQLSLAKVWDNAKDDVYESLISEEERARKFNEAADSVFEKRKEVFEELAKGKE